MKQSKKNEQGFSAVEFVLIIIIITLIGAVGWLVYKDHHKSTSTAITPASATKPATTTKPQTTKQKYYLDNNNVSYTLPSGWEVLNDSTAVKGFPCGQAVTSNVSPCVDKAILILKSDGYTNTDQFYAEISVFNNEGSQTPANWFGTLGLGGDIGGTGNTLTINNLASYKYSAEADPGHSSEIYLYYAIVTNKTGVLVLSDLFSGNHYSYQTTNNYLGYSTDVDAIAKSISIIK